MLLLVAIVHAVLEFRRRRTHNDDVPFCMGSESMLCIE